MWEADATMHAGSQKSLTCRRRHCSALLVLDMRIVDHTSTVVLSMETQTITYGAGMREGREALLGWSLGTHYDLYDSSTLMRFSALQRISASNRVSG